LGDNTSDLTILHDWDSAGVYGKRVLLDKMVYYFCVFVASYLPFLLRFRVFREPYEAYQAENRRHLDILRKLDALAGVTPIFGIRDTVLAIYPDLKTYPHLRVHRHIGNPPDPNRTRTWEPPLNQPQYTWRYESNYVEGKKVLLKSRDTYPIWHVDHPHYLPDYIDFLYNVLHEGEQIYE